MGTNYYKITKHIRARTITLKQRKIKLPAIQPPRPLKQHGMALWRSVHNQYDIVDVGGFELLALACAALDRAEQCSDAITRDGTMIDGGGGRMRENPLLKIELANRSFTARTLECSRAQRSEPLRGGAGRPPQSVGVTFAQ